ncbi:MAG: dGTP triphosphohydrolase, partial [Steroidobacteraceae bacterium]
MKGCMRWDKLMSDSRLGHSGEHAPAQYRSEFQRDADRIVHSSAFRRLQGKTQVFPIAGDDYVRTRLTHSIEVSTVGRSLGTLVAAVVEDREGHIPAQPAEFGNIVAAASLAHDIGNPPFGHSGENTIRNWFAGQGQIYLADLSEGERKDLIQYEGNAQGFRILTRLQHPENMTGLQLTNATLAAFSKYPRKSFIPEFAATQNSSEKKFGVFCADWTAFVNVARGVGLKEKFDGAWCRHPLAFLVEASDDICYAITDVEDGCHIDCMPISEAERLLAPIAAAHSERTFDARYRKLQDNSSKMEFLRARAINGLVIAARDAFNDNYADIMAGAFEDDLLSRSRFAAELSRIRDVSIDRIYNAPVVIKFQITGRQIVS